ncbi:MAG: DNA photolyase [Deltaproteobacteria bacterium]|nr:DNA photolyase [Deltaproteobacteria bacterium]
MIHYRPSKIYIDPSVQNSPITQTILKTFPDISCEYTSEKPSILKKLDRYSDPLLEGKKHLWVTQNKGKLVKKCGASTSALQNLVCCNYFILDFSFNCHFECVYCFLQEYTNLPLMVVYANIEEMLKTVQDLLDRTSSSNIRIGTGEMADSLALDEITGFSQQLVPFFSIQKKAFLELKTKSDRIQNLLKLDPKGQTVVAWSINPPSYIQKYDFKTALFEERLEAAKECEKAGYKIAFHLDPLIAEPTWKKDYEELVGQLFSRFNPAWVSLGALRFNANLRSIAQKRFPNTPLTVGEFVSTPDGKKRYFRQLREELYQTVYGYITKYNRQTPTYLCMENEVVWKNSMGRVPSSEQALEKQIVSASLS